jgi:lipid A ethanolaminephosphotransferase
MRKNFTVKPITHYKLIVAVSFFLATFFNLSFFKNTLSVYGFSGVNALYMLSLYGVLFLLLVFLFSLFASRYTTKPLLILALMVSSSSAYFMDSYNIVIDESMIKNVLETNLNESLDLLSVRLFVYLFFLGILPSIIIFKLPLKESSIKQSTVHKLLYTFVPLLVAAGVMLSCSKFYTSFFREHKPLRYYVNPIYWIYSVTKYTASSFEEKNVQLQTIGEDAALIPEAHAINPTKPELIIFVLGEATRADRWSLNGYERETNPLLSQEDVVSFSKYSSCATSTAESVPCMFSSFDRKEYSHAKANQTENILDVLSHAGVSILWRDNNSDSKGVALRVEYEDFKTPKNNPVCDEECRDVGMLAGLDRYVQKHGREDIFIVLHQMGNHGPAYYKRYPKEFETFTPVCRNNRLEECSREEINNAYDNAVRYSDYFLFKTIEFLKKYDATHEVAMMYVSDHGESLGENGLYLHGMPYFMAPDEQTHVASLLWLGDSIKKELDYAAVKSKKDQAFSHDTIFSTILSFFEIETKAYEREKDILYDARKY